MYIDCKIIIIFYLYVLRFWGKMAGLHQMRRVIFIIPVFYAFLCASHAQTDTDEIAKVKQEALSDSFFADTSLLRLMLSLNYKALSKDMGKENPKLHMARLTYEDGNNKKSFYVQIQPRGKYRQDPKNCAFPNLQIFFPKDECKKTIFENHRKLKMVNHCQITNTDYNDYVIAEYLAYKIYNQLSSSSYRVRLAQVTYTDVNGEMKTHTRYAFFIERSKWMAARNNSSTLKVKNIAANRTGRYANDVLSAFQYMIGNTDWSVPGLHNVKIISKGSLFPPEPVPYDFDWSGFVYTSYARPNPKLPITSVKNRLYRGPCRTAEEFKIILEHLLKHQEDITIIVSECYYLSEPKKSEILNYLEEFFLQAKNGELAEKFVKECR